MAVNLKKNPLRLFPTDNQAVVLCGLFAFTADPVSGNLTKTIREYAAMLEWTKSTVHRTFQRLEKYGVLESVGRKVGQKWDKIYRFKLVQSGTKVGQEVGQAKPVVEVLIQNEEAVAFLAGFNQLFDTNIRSAIEWQSNFEYWRSLYSIEEMLRAAEIAKSDQFWKDKITPTILFRRMKPNHEPVDRIGELLAKDRRKPTVKQAGAEDGSWIYG